MKQWINRLPWLAIAALVLLVSLVVLGNPRGNFLTPDPAAAAQAQATIDELQGIRPEKLSDPDFQSALLETLQNNDASSIWLIDSNGKLVFAEGSTATATRNIDPSQLPIQSLLACLPADTLSSEQQSLIISAAWIRAEGEHNDIYNHKVVPIYTSDGSLLGTLGMAYDINAAISQPDLSWQIRLIAGFLCLLMYWFSLALWVWFDARQRGEKAWVWTCFVLIGNLVALIAYLLTRRAVNLKTAV